MESKEEHMNQKPKIEKVPEKRTTPIKSKATTPKNRIKVRIEKGSCSICD